MTKLYYALKQQERYNKIPIDGNCKPFKYWLQVGVILAILLAFLLIN